jgi:hypothetical protein
VRQSHRYGRGSGNLAHAESCRAWDFSIDCSVVDSNYYFFFGSGFGFVTTFGSKSWLILACLSSRLRII